MDKTALLVMDRYNTTTTSSSSSSARSASHQQQQQQGPSGLAVIEELQFAFIAFVFGQSLEGEAKAGCLCVAGCVCCWLYVNCLSGMHAVNTTESAAIFMLRTSFTSNAVALHSPVPASQPAIDQHCISLVCCSKVLAPDFTQFRH
jgi:hypothetical protein